MRVSYPVCGICNVEVEVSQSRLLSRRNGLFHGVPMHGAASSGNETALCVHPRTTWIQYASDEGSICYDLNKSCALFADSGRKLELFCCFARAAFNTSSRLQYCKSRYTHHDRIRDCIASVSPIRPQGCASPQRSECIRSHGCPGGRPLLAIRSVRDVMWNARIEAFAWRFVS